MINIDPDVTYFPYLPIFSPHIYIWFYLKISLSYPKQVND